MNKPLARIIILFTSVLLIAFAVIYLQSAASTKPAPDVTFQLIDGRQISLADRTGKPSLIVFWATSCRSCLQEIPHFSKLYRDYAVKGFEIIAVAMPYDRPDYVVEMQKKRHIPYPIALDIQGKIITAFGNVSVTPNSFLVGPTGRIVKHHVGLWDMTELTALIETML